MYTGININEVKKYISPTDPNKDNPTVFHLGALDSFAKAHVEDSTTEFESNPNDPGSAQIRIRYAARNLLTVKFGIKKIENFIDPQTKQPITVEAEPVKVCGMGYSAIPDKIIAVLAKGSLIPDLATEINNLNVLGEAEAKN